MGLNDILSKIDKTKLPAEAVSYIDEEILSDVEGLDAIQDDNKAVIAFEKILREKYPDAFIQEKKVEEKQVKTPTKKDLIDDVETLKMIVEDLDGEEKQNALDEIEALEMIIEEMPDDQMNNGGVIENDDDSEEEIDLFEQHELLPEDVRDLVNKAVSEDEGYEELQRQLNEKGYEFDIDMDGMAYNLRKIK
jgi:hypothetical protein